MTWISGPLLKEVAQRLKNLWSRLDLVEKQERFPRVDSRVVLQLDQRENLVGVFGRK